MRSSFTSLYEFTAEGLELFQRVMRGELAEAALDIENPVYALPLEGTKAFNAVDFTTARDMAEAVCKSFGSRSPQAMAGNAGLWAWLTFVLVDNLFPAVGGTRQIKELHRWYPASPNDWRKAQRHLVRMPVLLFQAFGKDADHLICGRPAVGPDIREQLTSQQDMFSANFQKACRVLYFDEKKGSVKRGTGSKDGPGIPRRLAVLRRQLDVTWDMTDLSPERILELLPPEFDRYKAQVRCIRRSAEL
ncbi:MAG: hypothetical protein QOH81_2024 [Sphingomonadales bacterium]|jgi:hypothetical protein|nr:hypothetical protein [Sphingomonadales bacterium]